MHKIKVGTIGAGYWGINVIRNIYNTKGFVLKKCCDKNSERLKVLKQIIPEVELTKDYREIVADKEIDAVYIATPARTHYQLVKEVLIANKHVLVEKPFALNYKSAEELVEISDKKNKILMVGFVFLYNPYVNKVKECLKDLGKINFIYSTRTSLGPRVREDVNIIWDYAIHDVYVINHILDEFPIAIRADGMSYLRKGIEDVVFYTMFFEDGLLVHCHTSWYDPLKVRRMIIIGSKKMLVYDDLAEENKIIIYNRGYVKFKGTDKFGNENLQLYDNGFYPVDVEEKREPLKIECEHFLNCIQTGKRPKYDGRYALKIIKVLEAIDQSLKNHGAKVLLEL